MKKESLLIHSKNPAGYNVGMRLLFNTGLLLLLMNSAFGRAFHEEKREEISITTNEEEPTENICNCNWRYHKHYEAKGCKAEQLDSCGCPTKYICPLAGDTSENQKTCIYQNEEYKIGSRINVTDNCQFCRCLGDVQPQITCRLKECPQLDAIEGENCHLVYEKNHCCPSKYECVLNDNENVASEKGSVCVHAGITYPLGAKIYPSDDPCLICECNENWGEVSNSNCYRQDCLLERKMILLNKGCIPIYHEKKCCPIEFYCPDNLYLNDIPLENDLIEENLEILDTQDNTCIFGGKSYDIGMELIMKNPCVKCSCLVPPDLTCVHQSCPLPPKVEDCEVVHSTNSCCPSYTCLHDNMPTPDGNHSKIECPTPVCADETCEITIPEGHQCPTCICNESISHEKNVFEPDNEKEEPSMEETLTNSSLAEIEKLENENFDTEILIPIETEFSSENTNMSEKFIESSDKKEHMEYDEIDAQEQEMNDNTNFFEKDRESYENSSKENLQDELDLTNRSESRDENSRIDDAEAIVSKIIKKRSTEYRNSNPYLNQAQQYQQLYAQNQQQFFEEEEDENDREVLESDNEGYDELNLSSRSKKNEESGKKVDVDDLITDSSETFTVPDGCPTPICENSSCRIVIPFGHQCPTCKCKSREDWQP